MLPSVGRPTAVASASHPALRVLPWLALASVLLVTTQLALHLRNIPYWDEIDGVLTNLPRFDATDDWSLRLEQLFALQNEHRTFTSNLLFAAIHAFGAPLNFTAIAVIGDFFLVGLGALLITRAASGRAALRLATVLGLGVVHLQHHENFFWSGSSIDHFLVVLLAVGALSGIAAGSRTGLLLGLLLGLLSAYTLAHGFVVWPVGAALLVAQRRARWLPLWLGVAAFAALCYLPGFAVNPAHHIEASARVVGVLHYWLTLLGGTPAIGNLTAAPWFGLALLGSLTWLLQRGAARTAPLAIATILFCVLALAVIAIGRTGVSAGVLIPSRYCILSSLAWSLVAWLASERLLASDTRRPIAITALAIALIAVNLALNLRFLDRGAEFARQRDASVAWFHYYHTLEGAPFALYPRAGQADRILQRAAARGLYALPLQLDRVEVSDAHPSTDITYCVDELKTDADSVYVQGWAFFSPDPSPDDRPCVVFRSASGLQAFAATEVPRPDVIAAFNNPQLASAGFRLMVPRRELPADALAIGVGFHRPGESLAYVLGPRELALTTPSLPPTRLLTSNRPAFTLPPNVN